MAGKRCNEDYPGVRCFRDEENLAEFIAGISHDDFPENFSPWEILIVPRCQDDPEVAPAYAIVFRFHHVIADGVSLVRSFVNCVVDEEIQTIERKSAKVDGKAAKTFSAGFPAQSPAPEAPGNSVEGGPTISLPGGSVGFLDAVKGLFNLATMSAHNFTKPDSNSFFGRELQGKKKNPTNSIRHNIILRRNIYNSAYELI